MSAYFESFGNSPSRAPSIVHVFVHYEVCAGKSCFVKICF